MPFSIHQAAPRRAVIVAGSRTPFVRAFSEYMKLDTIALGTLAVRGLLEQTDLAPHEIDAIVWGGVVLPSTAPNVGREIGIDLDLPPSIEAMTVTRACASGLQALTEAAARIERGEADVVIAGGSDSTSNATVGLPQDFVQAMAPVAMGKKKGAMAYFSLLGQFMPPTRVLPKMPRIAERSTGEVMGESAEKMAKLNGISRASQDAFTVRSHQQAAAALDTDGYGREVSSVTVGEETVDRDTLVRRDTSEEKLARLRPVFDAEGSLTAGNSCGLTDGASATLLMSEEKAKALGYTPLAAFRSWAYVGVDPREQLLMGPALSMPLALERAGMTLADADLVDIHEAFAAQVLSVVSMLESDGFAKEKLGRDRAVGAVDPDRLNVYGGSISLGHPFAATGSRMANTMAQAIGRGDAGTALLGICAAGGLGASAVLEGV